MRRTHTIVLAAAVFCAGVLVGRGRAPASHAADPAIYAAPDAHLDNTLSPDPILINRYTESSDPTKNDQWVWTTLRPHTVRRGGYVTHYYEPQRGSKRWQIRIGDTTVSCEELDTRESPAPRATVE